MDEKLQQSAILPLIRSKVKERLSGSPAFRALSPEQRAAIAHDTVKALHYIVGGEDGTSRPASMTLAGQSGSFAPVRQGTATLARTGGAMPGFGEAARTGGKAFTDTIADVNFPAFVGGLIDGVFNSIVTSSIKQMEAYAELVKNVSKSVDQYMKDNVSENNARDYLIGRYPDHLELDAGGDMPKVKPRDGVDDESLPDFFADLGLKTPVKSLDEETVEEQLVPAARRRIAMDRQQLLATMVMMGVNRLVVTNGTIEASCLFNLDTTDLRKNHSSQNGTDEGPLSQKPGGSRGWHAIAGLSTETAKFNVTTVNTEDSEEKIKLHAQLGGKVKVNFKSDYFPMEKMIDVLQVEQIREKSAAGIVPSAQPAQAQLPPPPLPALPGTPATTPAPAPPAQPGQGRG